jgi:hypothetical protein
MRNTLSPAKGLHIFIGAAVSLKQAFEQHIVREASEPP